MQNETPKPAISAASISLTRSQEAALAKEQKPGKYVAIDCEMVGVGPVSAQTSILARVTIVNYRLHVLLDKYALPPPECPPISDYRTRISGIKPEHLTTSNGAIPFQEAQNLARNLIKGRVLVGHALRNDLDVLGLRDEVRKGTLVVGIRDTSRYSKFRKHAVGGSTPSLRTLASTVLGTHMAGGSGKTNMPHDPVEDAQMAMRLFQREKDGMEAEFSKFDRGKVSAAGSRTTVTTKKDDGDDDDDDNDEDDEGYDSDAFSDSGDDSDDEGGASGSRNAAGGEGKKKKKKKKSKHKKRTKRY